MDKQNEVVAHFEQKAADWAARMFRQQYKDMELLCESPIERMLLAALIYALNHESSHEVHAYSRPFKVQKQPFAPFEGIFFCPQGRVGAFRSDFLFRIVGTRVNGELIDKWLAVECDGHDFHERTKEQARRDRSRDREMTALGVTVMRFTGQEIHRSAEDCAWEVESVICRLFEYETE